MAEVNAADVRWSECGNYWYDEAAAEAAVAFFPDYCRLTDAEWAGRPFVLATWQAEDIIRPAFGWKRKDGTRRYRRVVVWVPRKNGKTELAAGVSLLGLIGDGEMGGQGYSIATDKNQASIVFDKATTMVGLSEPLKDHLTCFKPSIYCPQLNASFKPLSGRPKGKHGLSPSIVVGDEVHEWENDDLYTFVHQGTGARRQPLEFLISTAGKKSGYGWELWNECQAILAGESEDRETLVIVYAAEPDDDWSDEATWRKANPNLGISPKLDYIRAEYAKAKESPRLENKFKNFHLNLWSEQAVRWLPIDTWDECGLADPWAETVQRDGQRRIVNDRWKELEQDLIGRRCFGGLDMSSTTDLTAWVLVFPPLDEGCRWIWLPRIFVPEDRIAERVKRDKVAYDLWKLSGALITTPGNVTDYAAVKAHVFRDAENFNLAAAAIDRWNSTQLTVELADEGLNVMTFGQGYSSMSAPSKELERQVLGRVIDHGGHPLLRWCAGNVAIEQDAAENIKPTKSKSTERIDPIVAGIMGMGIAMAAKDEGGMDDYLSALRERAS
ncbi:terminase large subunit [Sphingomonas montanisoli]|uniref:terminase large subunit n=1 Tax=Sphingomonas montanisoli TaxID=2606412 RepID=UPI0015E1B256|nr:terminase TerL endonuclease subunit [Sphingomonas montanisoli]